MVQTVLSPNRSLAVRLVLAALLFCLLYTGAAVGVHMYGTWKKSWSAMDSNLKLIEDVYLHTLSKAVWEMDREALQAHIDSAAQVPSVGRISVKMQSSLRAPEIVSREAKGWSPSSLAPTRRLNLVYVPYPGGKEQVGELMLEGDERLLWDQLQAQTLATAFTQLLQSLLVAGLVMAVFSRTVTTHVRHIAQHLAALTPTTMGRELRLSRSPSVQDELSLLERGVNELQSKLTDHLEQLRRYEYELGAHRDHLAELVQARTAELESLTEAQQLVLSLSNRLIHAPHALFATTQRECLQEVSHRLGANHALWLVPFEEGTGFRVHADWRDTGWGSSTQSTALVQVPQRLQREELLFFYSQAEMGRSLAPDELSLFASQPVGACALSLLRSDDEVYGILFVGKPLGRGEWPAQDRALMAMAAQMLLHSVRHQRQVEHILTTQEALRAVNQQLEALSMHDALTGLSNRRHFDQVKVDEFQRALRNRQPLSVLVCDIDQFKEYNDLYGHGQGDKCLRSVAWAMDSSIVRSGDTLSRIGGEEFAVLLPGTGEAAARQVAERIRQAVVALNLPHEAAATGRVTISIGVAQMRFGKTPHFDALFDAADQALYRAKQGGRNRVEGHSIA